MDKLNRLKVVLVLPILMFATGQQVRAQCSHGGQSSMGSMQGRMQSFARQSTMTSGLNQLQQSSLSTGVPVQQGSMLGVLQQQQQLAILSALQQLQMSRQLSAFQQPQNVQLMSLPGQPGKTEFTSRQRKGRNKSLEDLDALPSGRDRPVLDSATDDEIAARRLFLAKDLADNAERALGRGERRSAARMHERASERLRDIVENYSTTSSAEEAKSLMQGLSH